MEEQYLWSLYFTTCWFLTGYYAGKIGLLKEGHVYNQPKTKKEPLEKDSVFKPDTIKDRVKQYYSLKRCLDLIFKYWDAEDNRLINDIKFPDVIYWTKRGGFLEAVKILAKRGGKVELKMLKNLLINNDFKEHHHFILRQMGEI